MRKTKGKFLGILLVALFLISGCAVKKMVKQAEQYEAAGMFKEATDMYYQALQKKPAKADYKIALKRTGQMYYEELASEAKNSFSRGDYKETVYNFLEAEELISKVERTGVSIKDDPAMKRYFEDAKDRYLEDRYEAGQRQISDQEFDEAKAIFNEIYNIDPDYKDTRIYLNQATFEPVYREGSKLFAEGRFMDAWYKWDEIYGQEKNYKDVKTRMDQALNERYKEGTVLLMNEDFGEAERALGDVYTVNPGFKDVKVQYIEARNEPIYRQAKTNVENGKCRTAYFEYDQILNDAGTYKDSKALKAEALKCAEYPVAVYSRPVKHYAAEAIRFEEATINSLVSQNNIFLKIFDLTSINRRLENRLLNGNGDLDDASLRELQRENNIKAVLILEYKDFEKREGQLKKEKMTGFERQVIKNTEGESSVYDKKISYSEYSKENRVALTVSYKLVSTENGEILLSESFSESEEDDIRYATYSGDKNRIYPGKNNRGAWSVDESGYRKLQSLFNANTEIKSVENLQRQLFKELSGQISRDINNFNPEK
jgi:tetratricopeptide (TPR) repeat protein